MELRGSTSSNRGENTHKEGPKRGPQSAISRQCLGAAGGVRVGEGIPAQWWD